ncbi:MAG: TolC family protein [Pseudomonadota bacterium]
MAFGNTASRAQDRASGPRLTLTDAVAQALAQHPSVQRAAAAGDQAQAVVRQVRAAWFPTLRVTGTLLENEEPMAVWPIHEFNLARIPPFDNTLIQGSVQLDYTLFAGGARAAKVRQAKRQFEAATAARVGTEQKLIRNVISGYLAVIATDDLVHAHDRRLEALTAELYRVQQLRKVGRAAAVEEARAQAALASAEADRVEAQSALDVARRTLVQLIGDTSDAIGTVRFPPVELKAQEPPDRHAVLSLALAKNPEIEMARRQAAASSAAVSAARGTRLPSVNLRGTWTDYRDGEANNTQEWNAAVLVGIPIFTGGAISGAIAHAEAARRVATEDVRLAEDRVTTEVDRALAQTAESRARVVSLTRAVESFVEVTRIEKLRLDTGAETQTDYLRAEADLLAARAGLIQAHHAEIVAHAELARVTEELNVEWLAQTLEQN